MKTRSIGTGWPILVGVTVADLNKDSRPDVILAASETIGRFSWYEAPVDPKTGAWIEHVIDPSIAYMHTFKVGDVSSTCP